MNILRIVTTLEDQSNDAILSQGVVGTWPLPDHVIYLCLPEHGWGQPVTTLAEADEIVAFFADETGQVDHGDFWLALATKEAESGLPEDIPHVARGATFVVSTDPFPNEG